MNRLLVLLGVLGLNVLGFLGLRSGLAAPVGEMLELQLQSEAP